MADSLLDIVDENDEIIGQALRSEIHAKGLLHREINVLFITLEKQIIFQKRGANKDTYPNLLDATAGGHVELGMTYRQAALAEVLEETGLKVNESDLHSIAKVKSNAFDGVTGNRNHAFREIYGYVFKGGIPDLKVEDGSGGFKSVSFKAVCEPTSELSGEFIPGYIDSGNHYIFEALEKLVS